VAVIAAFVIAGSILFRISYQFSSEAVLGDSCVSDTASLKNLLHFTVESLLKDKFVCLHCCSITAVISRMTMKSNYVLLLHFSKVYGTYYICASLSSTFNFPDIGF
jgi:hypothetical protein